MKILLLRSLLLRSPAFELCGCKHYCSTPAISGDQPKQKYRDTLLLPKTNFRQRIHHKDRSDHEASLAKNFQFDKLYNRQLDWRKDAPEFILHDGPPYANGSTHIGHAVNKILKDITNRYKLLKGFRVNYRPGWDCHGLPIELKALRESSKPVKSPMEIRAQAKKVAEKAISQQMKSFQRWGVMADWNSAYKTFDKHYIHNQLQIFFELYEKGLIYRDLKPIYWSPSSRTALAEAELEYQANHQSTAIHLLLSMKSNFKDFCDKVGIVASPEYAVHENEEVKAVIWTTTPWTLPANEAVAYNEKEKYSVVFYQNPYGNKKYFIVLASARVPDFQLLATSQIVPVFEFDGTMLSKFEYNHPWFSGKVCKMVHGKHVTMDVGTGLVHIAPAHGTDDFVLGRQHNLSIESYVNDDGVFDERIPELKGMAALSLANSKVCKVLEENIFRKSLHLHSYPYDWRTKKPVLIKASLQWFINTDKLKPKALEQLKLVGIHPPNVKNTMEQQVSMRPYWCISRQRVWGVPIPVLIHKETQEALVDRKFIDRLCELLDSTGNMDVWWDIPVEKLVDDPKVAAEYEKGKDIFDIWFDSGVSWHMLNGKQADIYLEGLDQFNGWFQSSLLTSVAARDITPYKGLYIHGFVVDETGKKMSKSLGNVFDPVIITDGKTDAFGADVLRWWCATQGSADSDKIALSMNLLRISDESIQKLRNTLRFLVSFCTQASVEELKIDEVTYDELMYIDQFMLLQLKEFQNECNEDYENYNYHRVMTRALHFASVQVSSQYLTWIKDRLYCDLKESQSRKSCIFVLHEVYKTLVKVLAPVLPFLCEEVHSNYCAEPESIYQSAWFSSDNIWDNKQVAALMELALDLKTTINHVVGSNNFKIVWAEIICNPEAFQKLQLLHPTNCSEVDKCTSELCDILQVSGIDLKQGEIHQKANFTIENLGVSHSLSGYSVAVKKTDMFQCHRCRRYCCPEGSSICSRCKSVLTRLEQPGADGDRNQPSPPAAEPHDSPEIVKEEIIIRS